MKQLLFLFAFALFFTAQAQFTTAVGANEKYIEIKATDTLMVNPDQYKFIISLGEKKEDYYYDDEDEDEAAARKKTNDAYQMKLQIEDILKKNKLTYTFIEPKPKKDIFSKDFSLNENAYEVILTSAAQLEKLKQDLNNKNIKDYKVAESKILNKEKYELQLIDKVMKKAETEATAIAKAMNVILDKPLNVSNQSVNDMYSSMFNNPEGMGGMGALFSMMGNMFKGASEQSNQVAVSKTLIVRYSIK